MRAEGRGHMMTKTSGSRDAPICAEVGGAEKSEWRWEPIRRRQIESERSGALGLRRFFPSPKIQQGPIASS